MNEEKKQLALDLCKASYIQGDFLLRAGIRSHRYFDKYQFESDPKFLKRIVENMIPLIPEGIEQFAGLEMGGIAISLMLSQLTGKPTVFVRKQSKKYGTGKLCEGHSVRDSRLLVVEDIVTTGGQLVRSINQMRRRGAQIDHAVSVVDRMEGSKKAMEKIGVELRSLFTIHQLREITGESL